MADAILQWAHVRLCAIGRIGRVYLGDSGTGTAKKNAERASAISHLRLCFLAARSVVRAACAWCVYCCDSGIDYCECYFYYYS